MRHFKVYFKDGNQKLFDAYNVLAIIEHIILCTDYTSEDISKIVEVK